MMQSDQRHLQNSASRPLSNTSGIMERPALRQEDCSMSRTFIHYAKTGAYVALGLYLAVMLSVTVAMQFTFP